ncbi:MAG: hypothetical protein MI920_06905, partial [Kiloniellales bacterium]|nr:hypothetical protein [Kiloniellales bacterium]
LPQNQFCQPVRAGKFDLLTVLADFLSSSNLGAFMGRTQAQIFNVIKVNPFNQNKNSHMK